MKLFCRPRFALAMVAALFSASLGLNAQQPTLPGATTLPVTPEGACLPPTQKVCVSEPKQNTRTVFSTKAEEYCLPRGRSLLSLLGCKCNCEDGKCDLKVRNRLVVKSVEDCLTKQCVVREVPIQPCLPVAAK